jgi:hypothetical protein
MDHRNAASVLPDPVGATTSALRPPEIAAQAPAWAAVGALNEASNHALVAGENRPVTSLIPGILADPTDSRRGSTLGEGGVEPTETRSAGVGGAVYRQASA